MQAIKKFIDDKDIAYIILHLASHDALIRKVLCSKLNVKEFSFNFEFNSIYWFFLEYFNIKEKYFSFEEFTTKLSEYLTNDDLNAIHIFTNYKLNQNNFKNGVIIKFLGHEFYFHKIKRNDIYSWSSHFADMQEDRNIELKLREYMLKMEYIEKYEFLNELSITKDRNKIIYNWLAAIFNISWDFVDDSSFKKIFKNNTTYKWQWFVTISQKLIHDWLFLVRPENNNNLVQYFNNYVKNRKK